MSESNQEVQADDLVDNMEVESTQSNEDKFFGVKTVIGEQD